MPPLTPKRINVLCTAFLSAVTVVGLYALYRFVDAPLQNLQTRVDGQTAAVVESIRSGLRAAFFGIPALVLVLRTLFRLFDELGKPKAYSLPDISGWRANPGARKTFRRSVGRVISSSIARTPSAKRTDITIAPQESLIRSKYHTTMKLQGTHSKGKALEEFLAALIASIDGFIEHGRNVHTETEEIDIVFRNESLDPFWRKFGALILVECKNWKSQRVVGKNEFIQFHAKLGGRAGLTKLGFLVCTGSFAETVTKEMLRSSRGDLLVVPIDGTQLGKLVESSNRSELLKQYTTEASLI